MADEMTLFDALRVLAQVHTQDDDEPLLGFVLLGGAPTPETRGVGANEYYEAWETVRKQLHMQVRSPRAR